MAKTRRGTCDGCGKVRNLTYPEDRTREVYHFPDGRRRLMGTQEHHEAAKKMIHYYGLCSECFPKVNHQDDIARLRREREPKIRSKLAYPIIGGPLDGQHAITDDFYHDGIYAHLNKDYLMYNGSGGGNKKIGAFPPSMIFVHRSILKPLVSGRDR